MASSVRRTSIAPLEASRLYDGGQLVDGVMSYSQK